MRHFILTLLGLVFVSNSFWAQNALPSPRDFLPHPYAEQFTPHHLLVDYVEYIAGQSPRVQLTSYGNTYEGRPLLLAFISSPDNLANLEAIRQNHLKKAGFLEGKPDRQDSPAIVWLSFGVHGNEAGASESSMAVLHALADPSNDKTGGYLENTIVILDPCLNPDGYSRYTHWYRQVSPLQPDPATSAREHSEPWPGGRANHYLFDLNRDWAWGTQLETRQRLGQYQNWLPHVHVDFHEQSPNSPYFFAPGADPYHTAITPWQRDFQKEVGEINARYFDEEGWLYFTREVFDLFYPGYGDTYPTFSGAIGMTYEQAGHGRAGRAVKLENGETLRLADRIEHHTTAALATVETASKNAVALEKEFQAFYERAQKQVYAGYKAFVIPHTNSPDKLAAFTRFLDMHQIRYGRADREETVPGFNYQQKMSGTFTVQPEDLVVSAYQPAGILANVLLNPADALYDSLTYDLTAWSAIYAFGLDAFGLAKERMDPGAPWEGKPYVEPEWPQKTPYAFLLPWTSLEDAVFLGALLQKDIRVRIATEPFRVEGLDYDRGTLLITRADNRKKEGFGEVVKELARTHKRHLSAVSTGLVSMGPDFGSSSMRLAERPRIAVLSGNPVGSYAFGATWYFFEQVLQYPVTILDDASFRPSQLDDFDLFILPDGYYSWGDPIRSGISKWIHSGGRIIATGNALRWLQGVEGVHLVKKEALDKAEDLEDAVPLRYEDRKRDGIAHSIPGSLFQAEIDNSHPMGFGFSDYYFTLKKNAQAYSLLEKGWNVARLPDEPQSLGFVGSEAREKIPNTLVAGAERVGSGQAIYLVDDPLYRAFWKTGQMLYANAVFFGGL